MPAPLQSDAHALHPIAIRNFRGNWSDRPWNISALYVGKMMSGILSDQQQLGPLIADISGLRGIERVH